MRKRNPRRLWLRHRQARAHVEIVGKPSSTIAPDGSVATTQVADVTLPRSELDRIWSPEYLERLARTYWRLLTRVSLGLLRILYTEDSRQIVFLARPFVLLSFCAPEYAIAGNGGTVTWRVRRGFLVARVGRGKGYLRISVARSPVGHGPQATVRVSSEVANFYPTLGFPGSFVKLGRLVYSATQLRIHVLVTNTFLRSLARLDLEPSIVGALRDPGAMGDGGTQAPSRTPIAARSGRAARPRTPPVRSRTS